MGRRPKLFYWQPFILLQLLEVSPAQQIISFDSNLNGQMNDVFFSCFDDIHASDLQQQPSQFQKNGHKNYYGDVTISLIECLTTKIWIERSKLKKLKNRLADLETTIAIFNVSNAIVVGPPGSIGTVGETGRSGPPGLKGRQGATGTFGLPGDTGEAGVSGPTGKTGDTGETGPVGLMGATGSTGSAGTSGSAGSAGFTGPDGDLGFTGDTGFPGATGATGPPG